MSKKQLVNAGFTKWSEVYLAHEAGEDLYHGSGKLIGWLCNGEINAFGSPSDVFIMKEVPWWEGLEVGTKVLVVESHTGELQILDVDQDISYWGPHYKPATAEDVAPLLLLGD